VVIVIVTVMVAAFAYVDYLFFKLTEMFYISAFARLIFCVISSVIFTSLKKYKKLQHIDYAILLWTLSLAVLTLGVNLVRPSNFSDNIPLHSMIILGSYILLPNRLIFKIIPATFFTIGEMWILIFHKEGITPQGLLVSAVAFISLNVIGILSARHQEIYQRKHYETRLLEDRSHMQLLGLATTDSLTGIFNRRHFLDVGEIEFDRYKRFGHVFSFVVIDINKFKSINDTYGHPTGDLVLQIFADILIKEKRSVDIIGRLGGDEFGIILPETSARDTAKALKRINRACRDLELEFSGEKFKITFSTGVTMSRRGDQSIDDLYRRADKSLYTKKQKLEKQ
jgi:diguanylate cyclase (GGDEF)-like protein